MDNSQEKNNAPVDADWLGQWLKTIQENQAEQIKILGSIRGALNFFVVLTILSLILGGCIALLG